MNKLRDSDIREVLLAELQSLYLNRTDTKIVNEMGILYGKSRVDIAVINGIRHGYEIKSESDTLVRLPHQIIHYNEVFNRMTIVVSKDYLQQVCEMVPKWWGITVVYNRKGLPVMRQIRKGRLNKNLNPLSVSKLLWKEEALNILKEKGLQRGFLGKPKNTIMNYLSQIINLDELQDLVNSRLKQRENWRNEKLQAQGDGSH
ncbi:sce7726 family protein [Priestia megaterium]|uniref:sce7726 family protein n=1 Tax=Priestia megaterium TaxID=1404 RepID=UPI001152BC8B